MVGGLRVGGTVSRVGTLFSSQALGGSVYDEKFKFFVCWCWGVGGFGMVHSPRAGKYMRMDYLRLLYGLW